nr:hypothetical protein [Brevibacterium casei]
MPIDDGLSQQFAPPTVEEVVGLRDGGVERGFGPDLEPQQSAGVGLSVRAAVSETRTDERPSSTMALAVGLLAPFPVLHSSTHGGTAPTALLVADSR